MKALTRVALAVIATGSLIAIGSPATAAPAAPTTTSVSAPAADTPSEQAAVTTYWTKARMQNAAPGTVLGQKAATNAANSNAAPAQVAVGKPTTVPARAPKPTPQVAAAPIDTVGKVFFTLGGQDYVCSGNVVNSSNGDVVSTAGHCLNEGPGDFATSWAFVPAYNNGSGPFGTWTARTLVTTSAWANSGDINVDTGFAVLNTQGSQHIADVTGATGVAFNAARGLSYTLYGYPAAPPFTGETLQTCSGTASNDTFGGTQSQAVPCDMTGGSSGGPWFTSAGVQNSVNSFGYDGVNNTMFGPYWGSAIQGAYNNASSA